MTVGILGEIVQSMLGKDHRLGDNSLDLEKGGRGSSKSLGIKAELSTLEPPKNETGRVMASLPWSPLGLQLLPKGPK